MATYGDQIAGLANGEGIPSGWTNRWGSGGVIYTVSADAAAPGGKKLNITHGASSRRLISLDAINADSDRATAQVIALVRVNTDVSGSSQSLCGPAARGSGSAGSETTIVSAAGRSSGGQLRRLQYSGGSFTFAYESPSSAFSTNGIVWLVLDIAGTSATTAIYAENDLFGTPIYTDTGTVPAANSDNWIGLFSFSTVTDVDVLWFSVGTGADDAPTPSTDTTAPVLSSPTGTKTGSSTASGTVSTNEANGTLYAVVTTSATPPSAADIRTGTGAAYSTSQSVSATGSQSVSATGLTASTTYYWHYLHDDAASNASNIVTSASFTTDAAVVVVKGVQVTLYDGATAQASITGITAMWWDASPPTGNPVFTTATASTDGSGVLELDLDSDTALDVDDPGHLMLYKLDGTDEKDSLGWQGRLLIQDIS